MAPLILDAIQEVLKTENKLENAAEQIAKDIRQNVYDITELCTKLEAVLTSPVPEQRVQGTLLLSRVLQQLPKDHLSDQQLNVLATFYAERLKDNHNVVPAVIEGINALIRMEYISSASVLKLMQSLSLNITCQSQLRNDRYNIYRIFQYLTYNNAAEFKSLSNDFVYEVISSIDGEQDPRNLDYIFTFMPDFIMTYPLLHLKEAMFEIFSCYFPIDFNETSNDPAAITRNALATKLADCLVASEDFIEMALDLALEKLESSLFVAKLDSLNLLNRIMMKSSSDLIEANFERIWRILKAEIFAGSDSPAIGDAALYTLRVILEAVVNTNSKNTSHNIQTIVLGSILGYLDDVNQLRFKQAVRIALVCVAADPCFAGKKVLDVFVFKLSSEAEVEEVDQRMSIFDIFGKIFHICFNKSDGAFRKINNEDLFDKVHHNVLNVFENVTSKGSTNVDYMCSALAVLQETVTVIKPANRTLLYAILNNLIAHVSVDITNITKVLLESLSTLYPKEFETQCFNVCMQDFVNFTIFVKRKFFYNFFHLIKQKEFSKPIINLLYANAFGHQVPRDDRLLALETINNLMLNEYKNDCVEELNHKTELITRFINLVRSNENLDCSILNTISISLSLIVQSSLYDEQSVIANDFLQNLKLPLDAKDLYIAKGLLSFLHEDVKLNIYFGSLLDELSKLSLANQNPELREAAHHLICTLINKMDTTEEADSTKVQELIRKLQSLINLENQKAVELLAWLAKGLVQRDSHEVSEILDILIKLLAHDTLAYEASLSFEVISTEYTELHLPVTKILYRQKFLHTLLNKFGDRLDTNHHLNAFMHVLRTTPRAALKLYIDDKVGWILFKCFDSKSIPTLITSLTICNDFVENQQAEYFYNNLKLLIPSCLKLSKFSTSMHVRILALKLLSNVIKFPKLMVMPYKTDVISELSVVLDDPKRLVRKEAVLARNCWYMLELPDSED